MTYTSEWFDRSIDRGGTHSLKWDVKDGELPMWVADMDFAVAEEISDAIRQRAEHPIYGYSVLPDAWYDAYCNWWKRRHGLTIDRDALIFCTGVVPAISTCVRRLTHPAEQILILTPVYNIFYNSIRNNGRTVLEVPLLYDGSEFNIDWEAFERGLSHPQTRLMILCNPHNPCGRIWTREELARIGDLCAKHHVTVLADEIHCDITTPGKRYVPFASVSDVCRRISVTTVSPTKAFNLAGLQTSAVAVFDESLKQRVDRGLNNDEVAEANAFAIDACIAAFDKGEAWLDAMCAYVEINKQLVRGFLAKELPKVTVPASEATYLLLLDVGTYTDNSKAFAADLRQKTGLYLSHGVQYGKGGERFLRMNLACPRTNVEDGLKRLKNYVTSL